MSNKYDVMIPAAGDWKAVETAKNKYSLNDMQERVDGFIQMVGDDKIAFVLDEEGLVKAKPINLLASVVARELQVVPHAAFAGDVMVVGIRGEDCVPLSEGQCQEIRAILEDWTGEE